MRPAPIGSARSSTGSDVRHVAYLIDLDGSEWIVERSGIPRVEFTVSEIGDDGQTRDTVYRLRADRKYHEVATADGGQHAPAPRVGEREGRRRLPI